jgi:hypothetical protein
MTLHVFGISSLWLAWCCPEIIIRALHGSELINRALRCPEIIIRALRCPEVIDWALIHLKIITRALPCVEVITDHVEPDSILHDKAPML